MADQLTVVLGMFLVFVGLVLAVIVLALPARSERIRGHGGAIVIVGPFPIVIGSDQRAATVLLLLAIVLVVVLTVLFLVLKF